MGAGETQQTCSNCKYPALDVNQLLCSECGENLHADAKLLSEQRWKRVFTHHWLVVYAMLVFPLAILGWLLYSWQLPLDFSVVLVLTCGIFALVGLHARGECIVVFGYGLMLALIFVREQTLRGQLSPWILGLWLVIQYGASVISLGVGFAVRKIALKVFG